jgi:predicted dehydrogenase
MSRVGILGCGVISDAYARKLVALPFLEPVACADLLRERAERLAGEHGIPRVLDPEELIGDPEIDVVLNLTIPAVHFELNLAAIEAGKSVYSEKPLAMDLAEGRRLAEAALAQRVRVGCAPDTFLGAGLQTCRKLIDDGAIGEPVAASAFMMYSGPEGWHPEPQIFYQRGAGPLFDMGPYYLTALVTLLGPARRITSSARITRTQREIRSEPLRGQMMDVEVPTHVAAVIDLASGPVATLITSFDIQATRLRRMEIHGSEATLAAPDPNGFGGPVQIRRTGDSEWEEVELTHANESQSRGLGLGDMVRAIENDRPHRASAELANHVLDLMESCVHASDLGQHVELGTSCERPASLPPGLPDDSFGD